MRTASSIFLGLFLLLSLAACVPESVHPLSDTEGAPADPRLAGLWSGQMEGGTTFVHFLPKDGAAVEVVSVNYDAGGKGEWLAFSAFTSRLGQHWYMNAKFLAESGEAFDEREQSYILVRYQITGGDRLTLWTMSEDVVAGDIRAGKVDGAVEEGKWVTTIRLTAGTDDLIGYVRGSDPGRLFANRLATFRRVR